MSKKQITAPIPGLFYRKPSPESPMFKNEGDRLEVGETIGLIEVMKTFTEVKSEVSGKILKFLVENEQYVDIGTELAEVEE